MRQKLMWRRAKAGHNFGKDTVVIPDGDPDARMVRCAIYDCIYIHVEDLKKLPIERKRVFRPRKGLRSLARYIVGRIRESCAQAK